MEKKRPPFPVTILSFSDCYIRQGLLREWEGELINLTGLEGTNCYLDEQARTSLEGVLSDAKLQGVHFLDSGNYHYVSYLWCRLIQEPFRLLMVDRHTDMQPSAFGPILSCGGWLASLLEENPWVREVILIGPEKNTFDKTDPGLKSKVRFFSQQDYMENPQGILSFLEGQKSTLPLYLSIDKDVCSPQAAITDWDQGEMEGDLLKEILRRTLINLEGEGGRLLGVDICGDTREENERAQEINGRMNRELLKILEGFPQLMQRHRGVHYEE